MLPKDKDLLLKEKVKLYNNIAKLNDCEGRLLAELEVYPTPRIVWEFEMLGDAQCNFPFWSCTDSDALLIGHCFSIEKPIVSGPPAIGLGPLKALKGDTAQAFYGELEDAVHHLTFYLPNTRFQSISKHQDRLLNVLKDPKSNREKGWEEERLYIDLPLDDIWSVSLEIRTDAIDWLSKHRNRGTFVTTVGQLYQHKYQAMKPETLSELQTITLKNALVRLNHFSRLLSYANGGYTGPLYIEGHRFTQDRSNPWETSSVVLAYTTTPLEQLCHSWITYESDLRAYIGCLTTFERMRQNPIWEETFDFTLIQYFQAMRGRMAWQVMASAAGAALERLSYTILVEDETNSTKKANCALLFGISGKERQNAQQRWNLGKGPGQEDISVTGKRLRLLLERIGITKSRGYDDIDDVPLFLEVRNDAVHPRTGSITVEQRWKLINQAIQWIDEVLLWRIGYRGKYLDRIQQRGNSTTPRYDLTLRDSSW